MGRPRLNVERISLHIRKGDEEKVKLFYPSLSPSAAFRQIIATHIDQLEASQKAPDMSGQIDEMLAGANLKKADA